jgi:hypothetical protein
MAECLLGQFYGEEMSDPVDEGRVINTNALVSWEEAKEFLPDLTDDDQDDVIFLINSISDRVQQMTGRILVDTDHTVYLPGSGTAILLLPNFPVSSIELLKIDSSREFGDATEVDSDGFDIQLDSGIIELYSGFFPTGPKTVYVEYSAGWEDIPAHIQEAVFETIQWSLSRFRGRGVGMESMSADGVNVRPSLSIPSSAWNVFSELRRRF